MSSWTSRLRFLLADGAAAAAFAGAHDAFAAVSVEDVRARTADIERNERAPVFTTRLFDITRCGAGAAAPTLEKTGVNDRSVREL
jgi:hypothetical protein